MSLPYQFRDFPLAVFMVIATVIAGLVNLANVDGRETTVTVNGVCCSSSSCAIIDALAPILKSRDASHRREGSKTIVSLRTTEAACPQHVWDSVAAANIPLLGVSIDGREYIARPQH